VKLIGSRSFTNSAAVALLTIQSSISIAVAGIGALKWPAREMASAQPLKIFVEVNKERSGTEHYEECTLAYVYRF